LGNKISGDSIDQKVRQAFALNLFTSRTVTFEKAAELSGISLLDFMDLLEKQGIPWEKDFEFLKEVDKFALEAAIENVDDAYSRFFKHQIKFPRFKSKKYAKKSYTTKFTNDNIRIDLDKIVIKLPKLKEVLFALPKRNKTNNKTLNPKFLRNFEKELIKLQKQLPKKIEGSKNYLKAKERLNLIHSQVTNQRKSGCNKKHDRDINASLNIRGEGMRLLG